MKEIIQRIKRGRRVLLFLDYDGTLVPVKETPEHALLHPSRRRFLRRLGKRVFLCVVSGRSLSEIQRLVAIENIAYIGNHGLEISCGQRRWVHPEAKRIGPVLRDVLAKICQSTRNFPGILVEDKGATGTIHYRLTDPALWSPLKEIVRKEVGWKRRWLKMTEGKRVFEIKPKVPWDKGKGIQELMGWLDPEESSLLIYIGDDQTDEDAFMAVNRSDQSAITIHVGRIKDTRARYRLANVNKVWTFLRALFSLIIEPELTT